jgi:two-component system OmpR family response regulator
MRILLLEDQVDLAEAMAKHLMSHKFAADCVTNIRAARHAILDNEYRLAIFDLMLPDGNAVALIRELRGRNIRVPIVIMSAKEQISDRIEGLEAGADDYLIKPFDLNELVARMHAVLRRYSGNPSPTITFGKFRIDRSGQQVFVGDNCIVLTAKEWALLDRLVQRPGAIVSGESLRATLNGFQSEVVSNTLEVFINRLRSKLGRDFIETHRGQGYRLNGGVHGTE